MNVTTNSNGRQVYPKSEVLNIVRRQSFLSGRKAQRGVVAIEYALIFLLGVLPLLFVTFSGVLLFAAKQSLTLAADNGARAALRYGADQATSCSVAAQSMQWLLNGSSCTTNTGAIVVDGPSPCAGDASVQCVKVTTTFDFIDSPFTLGVGRFYPKGFQYLSSSAVVQLAATGT